jgi:hypothetical protein
MQIIVGRKNVLVSRGVSWLWQSHGEMNGAGLSVDAAGAATTKGTLF